MLPSCSNSHLLRHVYLARLQSARELPIKVIQECCKYKLHAGLCECHARAHPSTRTKGCELKVCSFKINLAILKSVRFECLSIIPIFRIPIDSPDIHKHRSSLGYVVPHDLARLSALSWEKHWYNRNTGCTLRVSLMMSFMYLRPTKSSSVTVGFPSSLPRSSSCAFCISFGFLTSSAMAHWSAFADVSLPAIKRSYVQGRMCKL